MDFHCTQVGLFVFGDDMKICGVEGCGGKHYGRGYCCKHWKQIWRHGKILKRTRHDPNKIIINSDIAEIVLYNKKCQEVARAIIDPKDIEKVKKYKWFLSAKGYVEACTNGKIIKIHNIIMNFKPNKIQEVDHKNGDPLLNRQSNLRVCLHRENLSNRGKQRNNTSGFKGVWKYRNRWVAEIMADREKIHLGVFKDILNAARAYNAAALKYHGEFAYQNKI